MIQCCQVDSDQVTVAAVKKIIEVKCNVPSNQQSIVVGGKALQGIYSIIYLSLSLSLCLHFSPQIHEN